MKRVAWISLRLALGLSLLRQSYAFLQLPKASFYSLTSTGIIPNLFYRNGETSQGKIPFIIDRVSPSSPQRTYQEIAEMAIEVFFNENGENPLPWKKLQLGYLQGLQSGDLSRRKSARYGFKNEMFVARRVIPMNQAPNDRPLILDTHRIQNMDPSAEMDYVRGDVLGFVEITERPYGLGVPYDGSREKRKRSKILRPVLTNLSVKTEARSSGIGSKLLKACERAVVQWKFSEIVLEVEFDNEKALEWYKKRGYEEVFTDPSCRRFSTKGFFLTKERCAKICMRKEIGKGIPISVSSQSNPLDLFKSLRQAVFS